MLIVDEIYILQILADANRLVVSPTPEIAAFVIGAIQARVSNGNAKMFAGEMSRFYRHSSGGQPNPVASTVDGSAVKTAAGDHHGIGVGKNHIL